ncbi:MAG TPA: NgoMIV family type II restriction endonuclease [Bryobacteraceae bacterium]|nr:NgoMIV family type II restriction endonuclease [Bryobacteraceae bacterium]
MRKESVLREARKDFHSALLESGLLCVTERTKPKKGLPSIFPSNADGDSATSIAIAQAIYDQIQSKTTAGGRLAGQISGSRFEQITRAFIQATFMELNGLRPGHWNCEPEKRAIFCFEQYRHLAELKDVAGKNPEIAVLLGSDYIIAPDVLIVREPETDELINAEKTIVDETVALRSPLRRRNNEKAILHASISCKWTLRSDRAQNARSEALNLIRNRKGRAPHIAVVTGEPLPSRLASLALGTGDLDCVYHFALPELIAAVKQLDADDSANLVRIMVNGERLKDISDLPLDLAV